MLRFLQKHVPLSNSQQKQSDGEVLLALWSDLIPDLSELDNYGGDDYNQADRVASLLYEIEQKLSRKTIEPGYRRELLNNVLPCIDSGNAGLDDDLYAVAYAACYDDHDLRLLAEAFEAMQGDWEIFRPQWCFLVSLYSTTYARWPRAKLTGMDRSGHEMTGVGHDLVTPQFY